MNKNFNMYRLYGGGALGKLFLLCLFLGTVVAVQAADWQGESGKTTTIVVKDGDTVTVPSKVGNNGPVVLNMTGGKVTSSLVTGDSWYCNLTVNQSAGTFTLSPCQNQVGRATTSSSAVSADYATTIWNLTGSANLIIPRGDKSSEFTGQSFIGYSGKAVVTIGSGTDSPSFYSRIMSLGWSSTSQSPYFGQAVVTQNSGFASAAQINMMYRNTSMGTSDPTSWTLNGGELYVGWLGSRASLESTEATGTIAPLLNLKGGTFAATQVGGLYTGAGDNNYRSFDLVNDGSNVEIVKDLKTTLNNFESSVSATTPRPTVDTTTVGTSTVYGTYTQNAGRTTFDYKSGSGDQLAVKKYTDNKGATSTGKATLNGGEIYVRTPLSEKLATTTSFQAISAEGGLTVGTGVTVKSSMTGWKWKLGTDGKISADVTAAPTNLASISDGQAYATTGYVHLNKDLTITGGSLYQTSDYTFFDTNKVTQTGGVIVVAPTATSLVMREDTSLNNSITYDLSGGAFYCASTSGSLIISKCKTGTLNLSGEGLLHVTAISMRASDANLNARGIVNQSGGEAYVGVLRLYNTGSSLGENQYNLKGGELIVGTLTDQKSGGGTTTGSKAGTINLTGGTFSVESSLLPVTVNGSTVEIYGNVSTTLNDFNYLNDGDDATDRPTGLTSTGTMTVSGKYTQNSGQLVLDYVSGSSYDQLKATSAAFNGGEILIRTDANTQIGAGAVFQGISAGTLDTSKITLKSSRTGWQWKLGTDGKITADVASAPTNLTSISEGQAYTTKGATKFTENMTISGGSLYLETANTRATNNDITYFNTDKVEQTGGVVIVSPNSNSVVLREDTTLNNSMTYKLSGGGFYYTSADGSLIVSKCKTGTLEVSNEGLLHAAAVSMRASDNNLNARGIVNQSGGEAYVGTLRLYNTGSSLGENQYNLSGGELIVGTLTDKKVDGSSATGSLAATMNLTGGTFAVETSQLNLTNNGSTVQIYGNVSETLNDFSYLNDGDDATDRPIGFTTIGTMNVEGKYIQNSGRLVIDVVEKITSKGLLLTTMSNDSSADLEFDVLNASEIDLNGGSLFVNYDGDIDSIEIGTTLKIWGDDSLVKFGENFSLIATGPNSTGWSISEAGITYLGYVPEPATWVLLALGVGLLWTIKKK